MNTMQLPSSPLQDRKAVSPLARHGWLLLALLVLGLIALVYWPALHGDFVWDDVEDFVAHNWLTKGDQWRHYMLRDFNGWINYFRPLGVALFTAQLRLFGVHPGPMHAVSLGLHLLDTLLVGLLARLCSRAAGRTPRMQALWTCIAMLLFGLHPLLIEVVAWIGCQFDQVATLFMLIGLSINSRIGNPHARAIGVGLCYFLAACAKESAAVFPLLLLIFDWALQSRAHPVPNLRGFALVFAKRNAGATLAMFIAGLAYLAFRVWGLGHLMNPMPVGAGETLSVGMRARLISYTLLQYLRMLAWPIHNMSPIHKVDMDQFNHSVFLTGFLMLAIAVVCGSVWAALRRRSTLACIVLAMVVALLPVLNLIPTGFSESVYHDRYAINALAMFCILLPLLKWPAIRTVDPRIFRCAGAATILMWLLVSIAAIRGTVPFWNNDEVLWRWSLIYNPGDSDFSQSNLIVSLIRRGNLTEAGQQVDAFYAMHRPCALCAISVANVEIANNKLDEAEHHLNLARTSKETSKDRILYGKYVLSMGILLLRQGNPADAEPLLREAIKISPDEAKPHFDLADVLDRLGHAAEARREADTAIKLSPARQRDSLAAAWQQAHAAETGK